MTSSPKRPWFRFHLLTAVLMMVVTGELLLANAAGRFTENLTPRSTSNFLGGWIDRGWPLPFYRIVFLCNGAPSSKQVSARIAEGIFCDDKIPRLVLPLYAVIDGAVAITLLIIVATISESLIRRREVRRQ